MSAFSDQRTTWLTAVSGVDNAEGCYVAYGVMRRTRSCRASEHLAWASVGTLGDALWGSVTPRWLGADHTDEP